MTNRVRTNAAEWMKKTGFCGAFVAECDCLKSARPDVRVGLDQWFLTFFPQAPLFRDFYSLPPTIMKRQC